MGFLIKKSDRKALNNISYVKNATFWKDLLAFYDAYTLLTSRTKNELPDFCFENERLCLDGVCLFIKDSTAVFAFASLNPSIEYLKILYYSMASYSKKGELPQKSQILSDYGKYRIACKSAIEKSKELIKQNEIVQKEAVNRVQKQNDNLKELGKKIKLSNIFLFLSILLLVVGGVVFFVGDKLKLTGSLKTLLAFGCIGIGLILLVFALIIKLKFGKKYKTEKGYSNNFIVKKVENIQANSNLSKEKNVIYKLMSENYEYKNNLTQIIIDKASTNFLMTLNGIKQNQKLYENQTIASLAESHSTDVQQIMLDLSKENPNFNELYLKIKQKNWLYNSQLIRYKFLTEFSRQAINSYNYLIEVDSEKQNPFNIDVKKLVSEKVVLSLADDDEIYSLSVEDIIKSSFFKNYSFSDFEKISNTKEFRFNKAKFITTFYNSQKFENNNGEVYKMKFSDDDFEAMEKYSKIPTLFEMEEKLQNLQLNLENSSDQTINKTLAEIYGNMLGYDDDYIQSVLPENAVDSEDFLTAENEIDDIIEINDHTAICTFGDKKVVGFKIED